MHVQEPVPPALGSLWRAGGGGGDRGGGGGEEGGGGARGGGGAEGSLGALVSPRVFAAAPLGNEEEPLRHASALFGSLLQQGVQRGVQQGAGAAGDGRGDWDVLFGLPELGAEAPDVMNPFALSLQRQASACVAARLTRPEARPAAPGEEADIVKYLENPMGWVFLFGFFFFLFSWWRAPPTATPQRHPFRTVVDILSCLHFKHRMCTRPTLVRLPLHSESASSTPRRPARRPLKPLKLYPGLPPVPRAAATLQPRQQQTLLRTPQRRRPRLGAPTPRSRPPRGICRGSGRGSDRGSRASTRRTTAAPVT
jgi:hypothetical protein